MHAEASLSVPHTFPLVGQTCPRVGYPAVNEGRVVSPVQYAACLLQELGLWFNKISDHGAKALAEALKVTFGS